MNKSVKKIIVTSASLLMMASVGAGVSGVHVNVHADVSPQQGAEMAMREGIPKFVMKQNEMRVRNTIRDAEKHPENANSDMSLIKTDYGDVYNHNPAMQRAMKKAVARADRKFNHKHTKKAKRRAKKSRRTRAKYHKSRNHRTYTKRHARRSRRYARRHARRYATRKYRRHAKRNMMKRRTKKVAKRNRRRSNRYARQRNKRHHIDPTTVLGHANNATPMERAEHAQGVKLDLAFRRRNIISTGESEGLTAKQSLQRYAVMQKLRESGSDANVRTYAALTGRTTQRAFAKHMKQAEKLLK